MRRSSDPTSRRSERSLWENYREQIDALGRWRWVQFKAKRVRVRLARFGTLIRVSTPLASHPLAIRAQTSDTNVFTQIFLHREYRCIDDLEAVGLILDCGANVGYSSAYFLTRFPDATVIGIEPDHENFRLLQGNVRPYGERCTVLNAGVWSSPVGLVVQSAPAGSGGEWAVKVRPAEDGETASVIAVDVWTVFQASGFERISILKMDIEGSELAVFTENFDAWLDCADTLVIELHGQQCRTAFFRAIEGHDFEVSECEELTVCRRLP